MCYIFHVKSVIRRTTALDSSWLPRAVLMTLINVINTASIIFLCRGTDPFLLFGGLEAHGEMSVNNGVMVSEGAAVSLFVGSTSCLTYVYLVAPATRYTVHLAKGSSVA